MRRPATFLESQPRPKSIEKNQPPLIPFGDCLLRRLQISCKHRLRRAELRHVRGQPVVIFQIQFIPSIGHSAGGHNRHSPTIAQTTRREEFLF